MGEAHRISTWISAIIARVAGKKIVFWTHGIYGNEGYFKRKFRVNFYRLANVLFLYGKHGVKQLTAAGIPKNKLFVINNSLDVQGQLQTIRKFQVEDLKLLRKSLCKDGDKLVVFVGRLEKAKRLDLLLNAVFILKNKSLKIKVVLIGNGNAFRELYDLANKLGILNAVIFYGSCYDDSVVLPILTVSDICVSPGEVGLTAMHSLICGTPVITHDDFSNQMPEFEAIKAGRSGVFFRKGCAEDLAAKISFCLDSVDKGEINEESCREVIKDEYTPEFQRSVFIEAVMPLFS
ncbi:glycosyltransferase [Microbulbifer sp. GL-2]|uniref:glycosyltransferase n=1 Tax=Microbulbifer sp. GL-2 TaxID=2591606 RepID=UPI0011659D23|nr:glycosyltransferase [Microbulbifer sp. GL-2]BBM03888.1 hypothetical protein GL2_39620 [Microbulbifer sp. GL-2]